MRGGEQAKNLIYELVSDADWNCCGNRIPCHHLLLFVGSEENFVYAGRLPDKNHEVCSIFCFQQTSVDRRDATIKLIWTKGPYRRKGFAKALIGVGTNNFLAGSCVLSGMPYTRDSSLVYRSLEFHQSDAGFCIQLEKLIKLFERHGDRMEARGWKIQIWLWDVNAPKCLRASRKQEKTGMVSWTSCVMKTMILLMSFSLE